MSEEELLKIDEVTPQVLATLRENNIKTVEVLAMQRKSDLIDMGISKSVADKILEGAWKKLGYTWRSANKLMEEMTQIEKLPTGSTRLDELIGGGIETRTLTEIAGEWGAGKTQTLFTILTENLGENNKISAIFLDSEETFRPHRIKEIAESRGYNDSSILERTIVANVLNSEHFLFLVEKSDQLIKTRNIKLLLIDSLIAPLRAEYVGRETLWARQQILNQILRKLLNYAKLFNLAIIFTNQCVQSPTPDYGFDPMGIQMPTGGTILAHNATLRLYLRKASEPTMRIVRVADSSFLPPRETVIKISDKGIE